MVILVRGKHVLTLVKMVPIYDETELVRIKGPRLDDTDNMRRSWYETDGSLQRALLNSTGQFRVTLSLAVRELKSSLWATAGGKGGQSAYLRTLQVPQQETQDLGCQIQGGVSSLNVLKYT